MLPLGIRTPGIGSGEPWACMNGVRDRKEVNTADKMRKNCNEASNDDESRKDAIVSLS